jgi:hypothetical protein
MDQLLGVEVNTPIGSIIFYLINPVFLGCACQQCHCFVVSTISKWYRGQRGLTRRGNSKCRGNSKHGRFIALTEANSYYRIFSKTATTYYVFKEEVTLWCLAPNRLTVTLVSQRTAKPAEIIECTPQGRPHQPFVDICASILRSRLVFRQPPGLSSPL